jgi:hypothetical protein
VDSAQFTKLTSPAGRLLLSSLPPYDPGLAMQISDGLRARGIDPDLVAAALTQSRLRAQAQAKFGDFAQGILLTQAGLEQATRLEVAAHHAQRYRAAGLTHVADLTCGIGADSLAMAAMGLTVTAIEIDPATARVARANLARYPDAQVIDGDCLALDFESLGVQGLFADPARRSAGGRRAFNPAQYSPPLDQILRLRQTLPLGVKVGPGIPHSAIPADAEAQWVCAGGTVVEAGLWFGPLRLSASRTALVLRDGHAHLLEKDSTEPLAVGPLREYLYEPNGAVIRAGLIQQAASGLADASLISSRIAYVTASDYSTSPFRSAYRVEDHFPFSLKRLRSYLRERGVGAVTIKKRGNAILPEELRRKLDLHGDNHAVVFLTKLAQQHSVIIASKMEGDA